MDRATSGGGGHTVLNAGKRIVADVMRARAGGVRPNDLGASRFSDVIVIHVSLGGGHHGDRETTGGIGETGRVRSGIVHGRDADREGVTRAVIGGHDGAAIIRGSGRGPSRNLAVILGIQHEDIRRTAADRRRRHVMHRHRRVSRAEQAGRINYLQLHRLGPRLPAAKTYRGSIRRAAVLADQILRYAAVVRGPVVDVRPRYTHRPRIGGAQVHVDVFRHCGRRRHVVHRHRRIRRAEQAGRINYLQLHRLSTRLPAIENYRGVIVRTAVRADKILHYAAVVR